MVVVDPLFPTRSRSAAESLALPPGPSSGRSFGSSPGAGASTGRPAFRANVVGVDPPGGRDLTDAERAGLRDPLASILKQDRFPQTLAELLEAFGDAAAASGVPTTQRVFAVSEAGQIHWSAATAALPRTVRYVIALGRTGGAGADVLISSRPASDDPQAFLQVAAWDEAAGGFQFYERLGRSWFWEGSSWHALREPTRGRGPFDSHVNGALVMKELKLPWLHWHSTEQSLPLESFPPGHPIRDDPLFASVESADVLERSIVRPSVRRWTARRLDAVLGDPAGVADPPALLRHLLTATTVNVVSSRGRSRGEDTELQLPLTFAFDADALIGLLELGVRAQPPIAVRRAHYEAALAALGVALRDGRSGFSQPGDAFFAWPVPERSFEDQEVVAGLVGRGVLSAGFALAALSVDLANPIDSPARAALMAYAPTGPLPDGEIEPRMRASILAAADAGAPEALEAARLLRLGEADLKAEATAAVDALLDALRARARTPGGATDLMRLADSRRRAFRKRRLAEFDLTLPFAAREPSDILELRADGAVAPRPAASRVADALSFAQGRSPMALQTFDPPGLVSDLNEAEKAAWHTFISDRLDDSAQGRPGDPFDPPRPQFFNPARRETPAGAAVEDVKWTAFPRIIEVTSGSDSERWRRADASRNAQDEYCEWSASRDPATGALTRITFTCEGPEYWDFLAQVNPDRVLELYREHVDPAVAESDLFRQDGSYDRLNRWNNSTSEGAMHLVQPNNTLGAEIEIAGAATVTRLRPDGQPMTDTQELIRCGRYGARERHSDPFIGARVNFHARSGALITIANPVGIYFAGLDTQGWETPDGDDASTFWRYTRGTADRPVRAVLEVPSGKPYALGDVKIDGRKIAFAAQAADKIQMTIRAIAAEAGQHAAPPVRGCIGDPDPAAGAAAPAARAGLDVEAMIAPRRPRGRL